MPAGTAARVKADAVALGEWMEAPENLYEGAFVMVCMFVVGTVLSLPIIPLELFAGKVRMKMEKPAWRLVLITPCAHVAVRPGSMCSAIVLSCACWFAAQSANYCLSRVHWHSPSDTVCVCYILHGL